MKTEVYSWRVSAERKADLESEARREGTSLSALLDRITSEWLTEHRNSHADDDAEQAAIRKRAAAAIGSIRGSDPTRSSRASQLVREIIARKHAKQHRSAYEAEQARIRKRVMATVGTIRSKDPTRSQRTSELARAIIRRKHKKESNASRRTD